MIEQILKTKKKEALMLESMKCSPRQKPVIPFVLREGVNIIAELKRKSPSAGPIGGIDDQRIALYNRYATAISVLTDSAYFDGSFELLEYVAKTTAVPILCKDFIVDRAQIDFAYSKGADLILLIATVLNHAQLKDLYDYAAGKGLNCLVEVHTEEELEKISHLNAEIVGVNARDLDTLSIDLEKAHQLLKRVRSPIRVAESGIKSKSDIEHFRHADCFLIGETLMRSQSLESTFQELLYG